MTFLKLKDEINSEAFFFFNIYIFNIKYSKQNSVGLIWELRISFYSILQKKISNQDKDK